MYKFDTYFRLLSNLKISGHYHNVHLYPFVMRMPSFLPFLGEELEQTLLTWLSVCTWWIGLTQFCYCTSMDGARYKFMELIKIWGKYWSGKWFPTGRTKYSISRVFEDKIPTMKNTCWLQLNFEESCVN